MTTNTHAVLEKANRFFSTGDYLTAFDLIDTAATGGVTSPALRYKAILSLACSGATQQAIDYLQRFRHELGDDEDTAALEARLYKDQYKACVNQKLKSQLGKKARDAYLAVFERTQGFFSGINAATLSLLIDDIDMSIELAKRVLDMIDDERFVDHWVQVTRAEALLLLGRDAEVSRHLSAALASDDYDLASRSTTYQQLALICDKRKVPRTLIEVIRPPAVIHYTGHMINGIGSSPGIDPDDVEQLRVPLRQLLDTKKVGFAYGSLACGADLLIAEEVLRRGAEVHVVLPFGVEEFCEISVSPAGALWEQRFQAVLDRATSLSLIVDDLVGDYDLLFETTAVHAMGMANLKARTLGAEVFQIALWNGLQSKGQAGAGADIERWRALGLTTEIIEVPPPRSRCKGNSASTPKAIDDMTAQRDLKAMIFADVKGFSILRDRELPGFMRAWQSRLAALVKRHRHNIAFVNTWGDAAFLVLDSVSTAAAVALDLAALFTDHTSLPDHIGLRVSAHVGPTFFAEDPVLVKTNFYGAHVNKTARMEPCTPVGSVYVTEAFAALLFMESKSDYACEYAGEQALPKNFGRFRMYHLRAQI